MLGKGEGQGPGGVEILGQSLLGFFYDLGSVFGVDFWKAWEFGESLGGGKMMAKEGEEELLLLIFSKMHWF